MGECFSHPAEEVMNRGAIKQTSGEGSDKTANKRSDGRRKQEKDEKRNRSEKYLRENWDNCERNWLRSSSCQLLSSFGDGQCPRTKPHKSAINQIGLARRRRLFIGGTWLAQTLNVIKNRKHPTVYTNTQLTC